MHGFRKYAMYGFGTLVVCLCITGLFVLRAQLAYQQLSSQPANMPAKIATVLSTPMPVPAVTLTATTVPPATPLPTDTATPIPTIIPSPIPAPITARTLGDANLRSGPGTDYEIVGSMATGVQLTIVGSNDAGDWYQMEDGKWIAAFLVDQSSVPVSTLPPGATATMTPTPIPTAIRNATATPGPVTQPTSVPESEARRYAKNVKVWLDVTTETDMWDQMPPAPMMPKIRKFGKYREFAWVFSDGSQMVFGFVPKGGEGSQQGLILDFVNLID